MRNAKAPALIVSLTIVVACAPSDDNKALATRDSAGVAIVESAGPAWTNETRWQIVEQPVLQIGEGVDGAPDKQFANVVGVYQLRNGTIGVVDAWVPTVAFFDTTGLLLGRVGSVGDGPGEFPGRARLSPFYCGLDTLYIVAQRRVSAFAPPNRFVRSFPLEGPVRIRTCAGGRFVVEQAHGGGRNAEGVFTDSLVLRWLDPVGALGAVIDTLPNQETDWTRSVEGFGYSLLLFGRALSVAAHGNAIVTGFGDRLHIEIRDSTGHVDRIARVAGVDRSVTAEDIGRFQRFVFDPWAGNDMERAHLESRLASAEGRPIPAFAELKVDAEENIWARQYDHLDAVAFYDYSSLSRQMKRPDLPEPRKWHVFQRDGKYLGEIATPPRFMVHQIGDGWMLGTWRDENDIQFVRKYAVRKPG